MRSNSETLSLAGAQVPVVRVDSGRRGPVLVVTAGIHGDELTGTFACHLLTERLVTHLQRGRVLLFPSLNPQGTVARTREVPGGGDMNRAFPTGPGPGGRLARALWRVLMDARPDAVVDLHADTPRSIPYAIVDRPVSRSARRRPGLAGSLDELARATGLTVVGEFPDDRYERFGLDHSLAGAMVNTAGVAAVTVESGARGGPLPHAVADAVGAVEGVLAWLGMVRELPEPHPTRVSGPWVRAAAPRARFAGLFSPAVPAGHRLASGGVLGTVRSLAGDNLEILRTGEEALPLSWTERGWVELGDVLGTTAVRAG